jgi:transcriptional regulator with XRE-family HTH domain
MDWDWVALGIALRERRAVLRLTQEELASLAGVHAGTVKNYEAGKRGYDKIPKGALQIEKALGWASGSVLAVLNGGEPTLVTETLPSPAGGELEHRYRHTETVAEGGRVLKIVEDMLFKVYMAGGTDQTFEDFDRTRRRLVEVLKEEGIEIAERHLETSSGNSESP